MSTQNDIIRFTIIIELPTSVIANLVGYLRHVTAGSNSDLLAAEDFADKIATDFEAELAPIVNNQVAWTRLDWAVLDTVSGDFNTVAQVPIVDAVGDSITSFDTHNDALLVKFFTLFARRQGRKYLPGIISSTIAYSEFNGTALADALAWGEAFSTGNNFDSVQYNMGVWNPTLGFAGFTADVEVNDIASHQDRRKPGVGI